MVPFSIHILPCTTKLGLKKIRAAGARYMWSALQSRGKRRRYHGRCRWTRRPTSRARVDIIVVWPPPSASQSSAFPYHCGPTPTSATTKSTHRQWNSTNINHSHHAKRANSCILVIATHHFLSFTPQHITRTICFHLCRYFAVFGRIVNGICFISS